MRKRRRCRNKDCGALFVPCPQVPRQEYCSKKECQRARKREWNRKKLSSDSDYKKARQEAQQRWTEKNPQYWKEYRAGHPEYTRKNRKQQTIRNRKRRQKPPGNKIAKTDESTSINNGFAVRYKIIPIRTDSIAKTDECIVEIIAVSSG